MVSIYTQVAVLIMRARHSQLTSDNHPTLTLHLREEGQQAMALTLTLCGCHGPLRREVGSVQGWWLCRGSILASAELGAEHQQLIRHWRCSQRLPFDVEVECSIL